MGEGTTIFEALITIKFLEDGDTTEYTSETVLIDCSTMEQALDFIKSHYGNLEEIVSISRLTESFNYHKVN